MAVIDTYIFPTTATAGVQQGNPDLQPETADTFNIGLVWSPGDLTLSVDYYSIEITDVISVVPGLTTLSKCYNLDGSNPGYDVSNQFCALLERDSSGLLQLIRTPYLNLGGLRTSGVDVQVDWSSDFADIGMASIPGGISVTTGIGFVEEYAVQTLPGSAFVNYEGTNTIGASYPTFKALTTVSYNNGPGTVGVRWRYQDAMDDVTSVTTPSAPQPGVDVYQLWDIFGSWEFNDSWRLRAGINNVTDEESVRVSSSQTSTDTAVFDPVGRTFYLGATLDLN